VIDLSELPHIGIYENHRWLSTIIFRYRWQATLFHMLLNASLSEHAGTRDY
jgi:hypothetical protein